MSTVSVVMSWLSRFAVLLAVASTVSLISVLVLYFQQIAIPVPVMALGLYGLPVACLLGVIVVIHYIRQRRNS